MQPGEAADLAIFICCVCLLAGYVVFYFWVPAFTVPLLRRRFVNLISLNRSSRREWVLLLSSDPKEGINAVQTIRNQVISVSVLAAAIVPLASTLINASGPAVWQLGCLLLRSWQPLLSAGCAAASISGSACAV